MSTTNETIHWCEVHLLEAVRNDAPIGYGIVQPGPYVRNGIPVVAIRDLPRPSLQNIHRSDPGIEAAYRRSRVAGGDVLISVKGTTGRIGILPAGFIGNISRDVARLRLRDEHEPVYWFQMLQSPQAQRTLQQATVGSTRQELSIGTLKTLSFRCPNRQVQDRIAAVLSDADQLVGTLERLIVKKQAIKQGLIQRLLTGKTRLPGFDGPWHEARLGSLLKRSPRYGINAAAVPISIDTYTYIRITDIDGSGRFAPQPQVGVKHPNAADYILRDGELVFARTGASVGKSYLYDPDDGVLVYAGFLINVAPDPRLLDPAYLALVTQTAQYWEWVARTSVRSGQPGINGREYAQLEIKLPDIREQCAIASTVNDVGREIHVLSERVAKAKAVKQGMLQQLLNGSTRLPVNEDAA